MSAIPDWQLERYLLGELDETARARIDAARESDATIATRLAELERSNAEILITLPPARFAARLARPRRSLHGLLLLAPLGAALALLFVHRTDPQQDMPREITRLKGQAPSLHAFRRSTNGSEELAPGALARAHDVLQLDYVPAGRAYGVIVSVDGRGAVTQHYPDPGASPALARGDSPLPRAYELDDAPGFERFFFVTSDTPLDVDSVLAAARTLASHPDAARAPLPLAAEQTSILLRKGN